MSNWTVPLLIVLVFLLLYLLYQGVFVYWEFK